jgi:NADH pyrophosphatase NudC (nudix superfamily)
MTQQDQSGHAPTCASFDFDPEEQLGPDKACDCGFQPSALRYAAVSYIERQDGRLLCVWNQRYEGWSLPGGMVEDGESPEQALGRELREETSL